MLSFPPITSTALLMSYILFTSFALFISSEALARRFNPFDTSIKPSITCTYVDAVKVPIIPLNKDEIFQYWISPYSLKLLLNSQAYF